MTRRSEDPAGGASSRAEERFTELQRTAQALREALADEASAEARRPPRHRRLRHAVRLGVLAAVTGGGIAWWHAATTAATPVAADATADSDLFTLTNQDRASNGVPSVRWNSLLGAIGESKPYGGCGFNVNGRSYDMIQRNYFAHPILNCGGQYVFSMMSADGINYASAGENIGWSSNSGGAAASASYINTAFMNSSEHRANILNAAYTDLGTGSDFAASGWTGAGSAMSNVWMFSEEFAQIAAAAPPPPPPAPKPVAPAPPPPRNEPAPTPSLPPPAATAPPTPVPTPTPEETPAPTEVIPLPSPQLGTPPPPLVYSPPGLLTDSVESVLEGFLLD